MYWSPTSWPYLKKARNFTASSHQNAGFGIRVFKNFPGVIPPDPHSGRGRPPSAPNTQPGLCPGAGRKRPGVGTQTLVPLNFSAVVAPLCRPLLPNGSDRLPADLHTLPTLPGELKLTAYGI